MHFQNPSAPNHFTSQIWLSFAPVTLASSDSCMPLPSLPSLYKLGYYLYSKPYPLPPLLFLTSAKSALVLPTLAYNKMTRFTLICFVFLLVAVDQVSAASTGCTSGYGCIYPKLAEYNRKMLMAMKRSSVEKLKRDGEVSGSSTTRESEQTRFNDAELRSVPAGPDPLHHNGGTPKMPKSSP